MSETKPKKMVTRSVAVALGIICIILVVGLGATMAYYSEQISNKDNRISSLDAQIAGLASNVTNLQNQSGYLNSKITSLQEELNNFTEVTTSISISNGWEINMTLEKLVYTLGEKVNVMVTVTNISNQTLGYLLEGPDFDFKVYNDTNNDLYDWAETQINLNIIVGSTANPGQSFSSGSMVWPQTFLTVGNHTIEWLAISAGTYYIVGYSFGAEMQTNPIQVTII